MTKTGVLTRRLLSIREASEYTGVSHKTLYRMVSQRRIPFTKMGRRTMFDICKLDEWIGANTFMPTSPRKAA